MKKELLILTLAIVGLLFPINASADNGDAGYQVIIFSDGKGAVVPASWPDEYVLWLIDWYEYFLEVNSPDPNIHYC